MAPYELPAAIEQAIAIFRSRHENTPLYLKVNEEGYLLKFADPESGFLSIVSIPYDIYREWASYSKFEAELINTFESLFDEMSDILEGKTICMETVN